MGDHNVIVPYNELYRLISNERALELIIEAYQEQGSLGASTLIRTLWGQSPADRDLLRKYTPHENADLLNALKKEGTENAE